MLRHHPRGLFPLFFTEMWERFSFYCMMGLLTLYMEASVEEGGLAFSAVVSSQIYGFYKGFLYFTPLFGGLLADRVWGFSRTIFAGGLAMLAGHLALAGEGLAFFFTGLVFLIIGNGLFKPNISTMLGNLYHDRPELKDQGYNIFYMGINLGAFIAPLTANLLKNTLGWHYAFGAAAVGMAFSLGVFWACHRYVAAGDRKPRRLQTAEEKNASTVGPEPGEKLRIQSLLIIFGVVALFWMAFHQNGLTLTRWTRDHTSPLFGIDFSRNAALTQAINPFLVITLTPLLVLFWEWLKRNGLEVSTPKKMALGMVLTASGFLLMAIAGLQLDEHDRGQVTVFWLVGGYVLLTCAELCLSPMGLSVVSKLAPARHAGLFMGGWFVATAVGNYLAGAIGGLWNSWSHSGFFFLLVGTSLGAATVLAVCLPRLEAAMRSVSKGRPPVIPSDDDETTGAEVAITPPVTTAIKESV